MIEGINTTAQEAGIEQTLVTGTLESGGGNVFVEIVRADLTIEEQGTYDEFIGLSQNKSRVLISNTDSETSYDRMTSAIIVEDTLELDYVTMTPTNKLKVDNFIALAISL